MTTATTQATQIAPATNIVSAHNIAQVGSTIFINALPEDAQSVVALKALIANRKTDEEITLDLLLVNDRISTVLAAVRNHFAPAWTLVETWSID